MDDFSGETSITVRGNAAATTTLTNVEAGTALTSEFTGTAALTASLDDASESDDSLTLTLTLDDATSTGITTLDDIETINIVASGSDNSLTLSADSVVTLNITGDADLTVVSTTAADLETINASAATGDLTFSVVVANDIALTTGSGDDAVTFGAAAPSLDDGDTVDLGEGTNTLILVASGAATYLTSTEDGDISVSNVQTLSLVADSNLDAIDFDVFSDPTAFTTVLVTGTADAATITLTDIQQTAISIRNTDNASSSDTIVAVTYDKKDSSGDADDLSIALTNRDDDEDFTINTLTAAGIENITIAAGFSGDDEDIIIAALTATALETLTITGAANLTITGPLAATVETVNGSAATGDLGITVGTSDMTITGGDGDDTFTFGATINSSDVIDGGDGDDTVEVTLGAAAFDDDIDAAGVENIDYTQVAGTNAVTVDLRTMDVLDTIIFTADVTDGTNTTFDNITTSALTLTLDAAGNVADAYILALDDDGDADSLTINLDASVIGIITANDHETVSIDFDSATDTQLADLNGTDIASLTLTDDVADGAIVNSIELALDGELAMDIDLTGMGASLGYADAAALTAANYVDETLDDAMHGLVAEASSRYTISIADGRVDTDHRMLINLTDTTGSDTLTFTNTTADATNDIGLVTIMFFGDVAAVGVAAATKIDLTAFGISSLADLTFADKDIDNNGASDAEDILVITATDTDDFAGSIELVGVSLADLTSDNFIFA